MNRFALTRPLTRLIVGASLALLPLISAWNLLMPARQIQIGPTLGGVTNETPVVFSWPAIRDGSFQKAVADRLTEAFALRRLLIRINNEVRMELFGELTAPNVVRGAKGQLIERLYLEEYCARTEGQAAELAARNIPKLRDIQNYYVGRGGQFVYVLSPSKAAHLPEYFVDKVPCPSTPAARDKVRRRVCRRSQAGRHQRAGYRNADPFAEGRLRFRPVPARRRALERCRRRARRLRCCRRDQPAGRHGRSCRRSASPTRCRARPAPTANWSICSTCSFRRSPI